MSDKDRLAKPPRHVTPAPIIAPPSKHPAPARKSRWVLAADAMSSSLQKLSAAEPKDVDWSALHSELASVSSGARRLQGVLAASELAGVDSQVHSLVLDLADLITLAGNDKLADTVRDGTATAAGSTPLTNKELLELSRRAIAAARSAVTEIASANNLDDHKAMELACDPVARHLATAIDAATAITARGERLSLTRSSRGSRTISTRRRRCSR